MKFIIKISNQLKTIKITNSDLFLVGYFLFIFNQILSQSQFTNIATFESILKASRFGLLFYFFVLVIRKSKYPFNKKGLFWIIFLVVAFSEMILFNGKILLILLILVVFSSYENNINKIIKIHISALFLGLILVFLSSLIGILDPLGVFKQFDNVTGFLFKQSNIRYAFGFINSNIIPITSMYIYIYLLLLKKNNWYLYQDFIVIIINYIIYLYCGSRVCIILTLLAVVLRILVKINNKRALNILFPTSLAMLAFSIVCSLIFPVSSFYSSPIVRVIDNFLTARIFIMRNILYKFPINLFGYGEITIDPTVEYLVMDNGYISLFVTRGWIIGFIFTMLIIMLIINSKRNSEPYLLIFIVIVILANLVDNSILHYITFPIYIILFNQKYKKRKIVYE
ncbi:hypothetical protein CIRMBP1257_01172 [Enterococcus cecorum]|nr:hypothetical protein CIRMBP1257_01172 [Enterococcus cecorum]CAI3440259.1 hypothetical protein CIRMBP1277_01822 [Enterococcus cecorum]